MEQSNSELPELNLDSLIWSEHEISKASDPGFYGLQGVGRGVQRAQMMGQLKPDYGSLGQFMKDVGISKDMLLHNRKKKLDQQEDQEQKKLRIALRDKDLEKVLKQQTTSPMEKTIASKMIVENLFERNFGVSLAAFTAQNAKSQAARTPPTHPQVLADMLEDIIRQRPQEHAHLVDLASQEMPVLQRTKHLNSQKQLGPSLADRSTQLSRILQQHTSLKRHSLPPEPWSRIEQSSQELLFEGSLYFVGLVEKLTTHALEKVTVIRLKNVGIGEELLAFLLDCLVAFCPLLQELAIQRSQIGNIERGCEKIKKFIQESKIIRLKLEGLGIGSKDFCVVCLGIGAKSTFQLLNLRDNQIGQVARRCLDVLMKFHKQTRFDFTGNPILKELQGRSAYRKCCSL